jgi:hypothetical protein
VPPTDDHQTAAFITKKKVVRQERRRTRYGERIARQLRTVKAVTEGIIAKGERNDEISARNTVSGRIKCTRCAR